MPVRPARSATKRPGVTKLTYPTGSVRFEAKAPSLADPATGCRTFPTKMFPRYDQAVQWLESTATNHAAGVHVPTRNHDGITVGEAIDNFLSARRLAAAAGRLALGTVTNNANSLKYLRRAHGDLPVSRLTARHLQDLITTGIRSGLPRRTQGKPTPTAPGLPWKPATVNLFLNAVHLMLDQAVTDRHVAVNVGRSIRRHKVAARDKFRPTVFDRAEMLRVLQSADKDRLAVAWWLGLHGLRRSEIVGLRWSDVDLETGLMVIANVRVSNDGQVQEKDPKSGKPRDYPLPAALAAVLRRWRVTQLQERVALGAEYAHTGYVVTDEGGDPYHPETITDMWFEFLEGIGAPRIRLHDARHTFGTIMANTDGVNIQEVADLLGHAKKSFTLDTYVHSTPDRVRAAVDAFDRIISAGGQG
jgi:integrase